MEPGVQPLNVVGMPSTTRWQYIGREQQLKVAGPPSTNRRQRAVEGPVGQLVDGSFNVCRQLSGDVFLKPSGDQPSTLAMWGYAYSLSPMIRSSWSVFEFHFFAWNEFFYRVNEQLLYSILQRMQML